MDDIHDFQEAHFGRDELGFVYAVAKRVVRSDQDAEDVAQEAMLLAYRHRASFRGDSRYRTWLYRIAVTAALTHLRRMKKQARCGTVADVAQLELLDPAPSPEIVAADAERRAIVSAAIAKLDAKHRDTLLARIEHSECEVAAELGITVANVKIRTHRARKQLREALAAFEAADVAA
jgi:RNA polymerase sigma-70 factor (ECF subfamily)